MSTVLTSHKTALITGAASGIGFAVAQLCRSRGMHLALLDHDADNLSLAREILEGEDPSSSLITKTYLVDVGKKSDMDSVAAQVGEAFPAVDLVVLNAATTGHSIKDKDSNPWIDNVDYWRQVFDTNVFGPINGISALLPLLKRDNNKSPKSIVITGSKQGITNPPGGRNPAYNSTKGAIKILTEHLAHDLRSDPSTAHISAHLLVPGWTWTGLMGNVGPRSANQVKMQGSWEASQVAEELERGLQRGSFYIICPDDETDRALDKARMWWGCDDIIEDRPALSRWESGWREMAEKAIRDDAERRRRG
ncbi:hypothetical protein BJX61DRAFT_172957 [Aspergillus egyptiacus]|nr:hypothetical protein BJX61DRAFT_172957 [Aspergillus egyptiacus]